jgi:hypothetical protein
MLPAYTITSLAPNYSVYNNKFELNNAALPDVRLFGIDLCIVYCQKSYICSPNFVN